MDVGPPVASEPYRCAACGFALWLPVADLDVAVVGLYDDARFPGRCLVALREHAEHLHDLDDHTVAALMAAATRVGRTVRDAVAADRLNYAVLGNTEAHVHVHVIPRIHTLDPIPKRPPWEHPDAASALPERERTRLLHLLRSRLNRRV